MILYLCRRGQENLRELTKTSFAIKIGANGCKYIEKDIDELTKNHRENDEIEDAGIIAAKNDELCPVKSYEKYISKLNPKVEFLFQRPKKVALKDGPWYDAQVVGVNSLEKFMTNTSGDAKLSQRYTNHSIRATTITLLDGEGYESRNILTVSGHRSANSLRSYCRTNLKTKYKMSEALSCGRIDETDLRLSTRNFNFGLNLLNDDTVANFGENLPGCSRNRNIEKKESASIYCSVNSIPGGLPTIISNNTNCVFNIKS